MSDRVDESYWRRKYEIAVRTIDSLMKEVEDHEKEKVALRKEFEEWHDLALAFRDRVYELETKQETEE
jgi:hypothetical protein